MRKDVRIGLSIGGVLLAVLIVYLLVPKETNSNRGTGQVAQSNTGTTGQGSSTTTPPPSTLGTASDPGFSQPNTVGTPTEPTPAPKATDGLADTGGTTPPGAAGPGDNPSQADAGTSVDWGKILNDGVMPESLIATKKDPFAEDKRNDTQSRNTPAGPIDWTGTSGGGSGTPSSPGHEVASNSGTSSGGTAAKPVSPPPAVVPAAPANAKPGEHVIQRGETYSSIALAVYGDVRHWKDIQKANPNVDDTRLRPGTTIKLPDPASVKAQASQSARAVPASATVKAETPIDPSKEYKVLPGDSLQKIALRLYGKATKSEALHDLNREKIPDEHKLRAGTILKLPEPPIHSPTVAR